MQQQASKDIVVAAVITDIQGRIVLVEASHKDGLIFPGGYVEKGESPSAACAREVEAELGIRIERPERLLSVDYCDSTEEYIMFIFDCGVFTDEQIRRIVLPPTLRRFELLPPGDAQPAMRRHSARRLMPTLAARGKTGIAYMEHEEIF